VAFFVNAYLDLGIKERDVSYFSIWKSEKNGKNSYKYKNTLLPGKNYALASLYWIGKDFYVPFVDSPNPQAKHISDIRNAFEHKYSKICWLDSDEASIEIEDSLALHISETELKEEGMRLLKLLRETIVCLALAVGIEEYERHNASPDKKVLGLQLLKYDDKWKL